jgi:hypothetical protein
VVTSANGIPLGGVDVRLYYAYEYFSSTPVDTQQVIVRDSTKIVDVAVVTPEHVLVRQLFLGLRSSGPLPRFSWDGKDNDSNAVPSGEYLVRYIIDTVIVKYSPLVVDGHVSATTDRNGFFSLGAERFPVDVLFDAYFLNGSYDATFRVLPTIDLSLQKAPLAKGYSNIVLAQNQVTTITLTLE